MADSPDGDRQDVTVVIEGEWREAVADVSLVGECQVGDELVVNVQARELGLGSGGFDLVHVNLSRGLEGTGTPGAHVMKLNYTSLQHAVLPVESDDELELPLGRPAAVLALHGQLAAVAWAFRGAAPEARLGYVQTAGGALPGGHSRVVRELLDRGLLAGHVTAGPCYGGQAEAISVAGALHHGLARQGWDAAVCGPGPGIVGSSSALGHGGMAALDSAHTALALGCRTVLVARMSSADDRPRHRGLSHHTLTVLDLLLEPVTVALPAGLRSPVGAELGAGLRGAFGGAGAGGAGRDAGGEAGGEAGGRDASEDPAGGDAAPAPALDVARPARVARHDWRRMPIDLVGYGQSGLPAETMGRTLASDPLFFGAALAGGAALAELATGGGGRGAGRRTAGGGDPDQLDGDEPDGDDADLLYEDAG